MADTQQLWFLVGESIDQMAFKHVRLTLPEVERKGISMNSILALLEQPIRPEDFTF